MEDRDEHGRLLPGHKAGGRPSRKVKPEPLGIGLDDPNATLTELYARVARALDSGRVTTAMARTLVEFLKLRATVVAADEFARRLDGAGK